MHLDNPNPNLKQAMPAHEEDYLREPTKEELLEDLRIALRDVLAGEEGIPALEGLAAIEKRIYGDADHS